MVALCWLNMKTNKMKDEWKCHLNCGDWRWNDNLTGLLLCIWLTNCFFTYDIFIATFLCISASPILKSTHMSANHITPWNRFKTNFNNLFATSVGWRNKLISIEPTCHLHLPDLICSFLSCDWLFQNDRMGHHKKICCHYSYNRRKYYLLYLILFGFFRWA